ncbi:cytokine receptor-like factor 2 isoform X2 [Anolis carolinensis]|uniref:Fibronectin type-III domain-containing protein n=1 Tax=Anolis carolinensis TaxID=28377 RepID=A0A803T675_ANOCA
MEWGIQNYVIVNLWINMLTPQTWAQVLHPSKDACQEKKGFSDNILCSNQNYTIVCFQNNQTEVKWDDIKFLNVTMFYRLDGQDLKHCPQYTFDQGYKIGCVFQAEHNANLQIFIKDANVTKDLYDDEQNIFKYLKPNPPENITIQWVNDEVTAKCITPKGSHDFNFEFQYKSNFNKYLEIKKNECCKIKVQGFDPGKCYSFRFRLKNNNGDYFSEWSAESHWTSGSSVDSCSTDAFEPGSNTVILLTSVMGGFLIIFVLLLCVCRLSRIRNTLIPIVPDPKHVYSEIFTGHNRDFQEWASKTENLLAKTNLQRIEEECIIEEKGADFQESKVEA